MQDRSAINRMLQAHGLGRLEEGAGLLAQLGYLVQDDEHFRSLLMRCEPEMRREMYESMRPYLSFTPKPLDVYMSEAGAIAEAKQLPTIGPGGQLQEYKPAEVRSIESAIAAADPRNKGALTLVCRRCTREEAFPGHTKADAIKAAREAGWTYGLDAEGKGREICPDCPSGKAN